MNQKTKTLSLTQTIIGILPILFVAAATYHYIQSSTLFSLLWMCNICNITLALGILLQKPTLIWVSTLWLVWGIPLWILDVVAYKHFNPHALLTHIVAAVIGLYAIKRIPKPSTMWWKAVIFGASIQLLTRLVTPNNYNINVSNRPYDLFYPFITQYWIFFLMNLTLSFILFLES